MSRVRAELGPEALILATRRVGDGVELTAALETEAVDAAALRPEPVHADPALRSALAFHGVPQALADALSVGPLPERLLAQLAFAPLPIAGQARPAMLAGPPGAGKTLSVVRLAARLVMSGVVPMVITTDGKRAGAVEQLAAFTRLLGITLIVANEPIMLGRALARRAAMTPVLIDTPGCDPFDPAQQQELAALASVADAEVALVLPAGIDAAEAADLALAFSAAGARLLVATRLDLARRIGGVLQAAAAGRLALAEAGIGPGAADGLVPMTAAFLAERLLKPVPEVRMKTDATSDIAGTARRDAGRLIAVASGKGGVGKTWFAITLAHALANRGRRALLIDFDLGLANVDIQLGLLPERDLGLLIAGRAQLADIAAPFAPGGFDIAAGRSGSGALSAPGSDALDRVLAAARAAADRYDEIILDLGAGIERSVRQPAAAADTLLVVATEEPTSLTDAYAVLKLHIADAPGGDTRIVVNQAGSRPSGERTFATLARACTRFLRRTPVLAGVIRRDDRVGDAIRRQTPLLTRHPTSPAAADVEAILDDLVLSARGLVAGARG